MANETSLCQVPTKRPSVRFLALFRIISISGALKPFGFSQYLILHIVFILLYFIANFGVLDAQDLKGKQAGVFGIVYGYRSYRNTARHLDDGKERIEAV